MKKANNSHNGTHTYIPCHLQEEARRCTNLGARFSGYTGKRVPPAQHVSASTRYVAEVSRNGARREVCGDTAVIELATRGYTYTIGKILSRLSYLGIGGLVLFVSSFLAPRVSMPEGQDGGTADMKMYVICHVTSCVAPFTAPPSDTSTAPRMEVCHRKRTSE